MARFVVADAIQRRVRFSASDDEFSVRGVLFNDFPKVVDGYSRHHGTSVNAETIDFSDVDSFVDEHDLLRSEEEFCGPGGVLVRHAGMIVIPQAMAFYHRMSGWIQHNRDYRYKMVE